MTYQEWKQVKAIHGEDARRVVREFELNNPGLTAIYEQKHEKEVEDLRDALKIEDRMERWKRIAKISPDPTFAERRRREHM